MAEEVSSTGLAPNVAALLCYLFMFLSGAVFYVVEKQSDFVRFHAVQSILAFGGLFAVSLGLGVVSTAVFPVPAVGPIIAAVFGVVSILILPLMLILWPLLMYRGYQGDRYRLPFIGSRAERYV